MKRKTRQSRRKTPWDGKDMTPTQQFIHDKHKMHYEQRHPSILDSGEASLINSFVPSACPFCHTTSFVKFGHDRNGIQRYRCVSCRQSFKPTTGTIFDSRRIPISEWIEYCTNIFRYVSLNADSWNNKNALSNMIRRLTMTLSYLTFPLMFVLLICAKPLIVLLYSDRWVDCVPYFQVLCIAALADCLQSVNNQSIAAIGKGQVMLTWTIVKRVMGFIFVLVGLLLYGMKGLLVGMIFNSWFSYFVNISQVSKYIGYNWWKQLRDILPVLVSSCLIAIICYLLSNCLGLTMYLDGLFRFGLFVVLYFACSLIFKMEAYQYTKSIAIYVYSKAFRKKE